MLANPAAGSFRFMMDEGGQNLVSVIWAQNWFQTETLPLMVKTQICGIVSRPLGGHRRKSRFTSEKSNPSKTRAFVARLGPGLMVPVRIEVDLFFGQIVTRLDVKRSRLFNSFNQIVAI